MTCFLTSLSRVSRSISSECCEDRTTVSIAHRAVVGVVLDGDLGLAVGTEVRERPVLAHRGELLGEALRDHDRQRHEHVGVVAGVAEHQALVAGALLVHRVHRAGARLVAGVDALGDVAGLAADRDHDAAGLAVEALLGRVVADLEDPLADDLLDVDVAGGGDLTGHDDEAGREQRLDGDAAVLVLPQHLVEDGVADLVGDLVRVTLGHGLRGEQTSRHSSTPIEIRDRSRLGGVNLAVWRRLRPKWRAPPRSWSRGARRGSRRRRPGSPPRSRRCRTRHRRSRR